jgi:hypothetical protein
MNDEFYIGWEERAPARIASRLRQTVVLLLLIGALTGTALAVSQRLIGTSVFEWGKIKEFSGILKAQPYPHLLVRRPGLVEGQEAYSSYYLVKPFKFGLDPQALSQFDGTTVTLQGTLIYREHQTMIEVAGDSIKSIGAPQKDPVRSRTPEAMPLGQQTLVGEIVDSKCFLGVMNPGQLTPHRGCAIRCISGGIPPVLLVRQGDGTALYYLLVSRTGDAVSKEILDMVAEPIQITGEVIRQGDLLILRADPAGYRRVKG